MAKSKINLKEIKELAYIKNKPIYLVHVGEIKVLPRQLIEVFGCESGYCVVLDNLYKIIGACMNALQHGYYACYVVRDSQVSVVHAPTMRIDKDHILKTEEVEELCWDIDQL